MEIFHEINDIITRTGFPEQTPLPNFHIIRMKDSGPDFVQMMPPHQQRFYQIGFQSKMIDTEFSLQTRQFSGLDNLLYFVAPYQTMSWVVSAQNDGYILYFKSDFLPFASPSIEAIFPFFQLINTSLYQLSEEDCLSIIRSFQHIRSVFKGNTAYQVPQLQGLLWTLLHHCKALIEKQEQQNQTIGKPQIIAAKYQELVQKFFLEKRKIEDYASLLHITPNHLSAVVKAVTQRTAKEILHERLFIEARNLLIYTDNDIAEIAYQLGFEETTHFGRFFKRQTNMSPSEWRKFHSKS
jgi:AraC family transcriptional regulator, transcriptional activator of pobA